MADVRKRMQSILWFAALSLALIVMASLCILAATSEELEIPMISATQIDAEAISRAFDVSRNVTDSEEVADYEEISDEICNLGHFLNNDQNARTIVFRCTGNCGGLGDRLRGIISMFYAALLLGCRFRIVMEKPFPMSDFFQPTCTAFNVSDSDDVIGRSDAPELDNFCKDNLKDDNVDLNDYFFGRGDTVVAVKSNADYWQEIIRNRHLNETSLAKRLRALNFVETGHIALNLLFGRPTFSIPADIVRPLVSVHVRSGDYSIGRQAFSRSVRRRMDEQVQMARAWLDRHRVRNFTLFVSSDNDEAARLIHDALHAPFRIPPFDGEILHVDMQQDRPRAEYRRTVQDWVALGMSDVLVMGHSGFPLTSAIWKMRPREVIQSDVAGVRVIYRRPDPAARPRVFLGSYADVAAYKERRWWG